MTESRRELPSEGPIRRALRLIRIVAEADGELSLKEAAARLQLPLSTTHRLLQVLGEEGIVEKSAATQRYRAGIDLDRIGRLIASRKGWDRLVRPYLETLVQSTSEAALFVAYLPATRQVSVMALINSPHPLRYDLHAYETHSAAWGATGRSILGFLPEAEQRAIWQDAGPAPASGERLPDWPVFSATLAAIRERGYAISRGQKIEGAVGIGAPVRDADGRIAGSLCLSVPELRFDRDAEPAIAGLLIRQADALSAALEWSGRPGQPDAEQVSRGL